MYIWGLVKWPLGNEYTCTNVQRRVQRRCLSLPGFVCRVHIRVLAGDKIGSSVYM